MNIAFSAPAQGTSYHQGAKICCMKESYENSYTHVVDKSMCEL